MSLEGTENEADLQPWVVFPCAAVILTCWHMVFATLATQLLARTTTLLDGRLATQRMTKSLYLRAVVPIGLLYSGSMVCSTLVYLHLSVPFIQMLKAAGPIAVLAVRWLSGRERGVSGTRVRNVMVIVAGVAVASAGEVGRFSTTGILLQAAGLLFEAVRVTMIESLVSTEGLRMDPLVSLYYFAPICAVANLLLSFFEVRSTFEWTLMTEIGPEMLWLNALVAFLLNVSSVFLIGKTSSLTLVLTGILKNILLVATAVIGWGESITIMQTIGYATALLGLYLHMTGENDKSQGGLTSTKAFPVRKSLMSSLAWDKQKPNSDNDEDKAKIRILTLGTLREP